MKMISETKINKTEVSLRPKLLGQTTDIRKYPSREIFKYIYSHFHEKNCQQFLNDIQPWIAFIKEKKPLINLPCLF